MPPSLPYDNLGKRFIGKASKVINKINGGDAMRIARIMAVLIAVACTPLLSRAAEMKFTSSTQYLFYQDFLVDDHDQQDVAQYLRLNVSKLDKAGKASLYTYGRVSKQVSSDEDVKGRLYYAFLDYRDVIQDRLDVRAGRTYVNSAAISGTIDGAYVDVKKLGPVGITAFGGRHVIFDDKQETGTHGDALVGASVYLDTVKYTHVEVSYGRKYTDSDLAREHVGLDFTTTPHETVNVYGRVQYDTSADRISEFLLGAKLAPLKQLIVRPEYYQSRPTFDKDSFYSYFNVNNFKEASLAADYLFTKNYQLNARYAYEDFGSDATADVYEIGFSARPIKDLSVSVSYEKRTGYAGELSGIRLYGGYRISKALVSAGIDYDDFRREQSRDGNAKKYWAGVNYEITKMFAAAVKLENNVNYNFSHAYQGFASINVSY
jgi:hypothetical protein